MTSKIRLFVGLFCLVFSANAFAQESRLTSASSYVISAKAGRVNYVEGSVSVARQNRTSGTLLTGDNIQILERVSTGENARAEILLNPGSFLRVGSSTSFDFVSTSLDDLQINLHGGSAVFEVIADDDFRITVRMPRTSVAITHSGVYRFDVDASGDTRASVIKGKLFVGAGGSTEVKAGRVASIRGNVATVTRFDGDDKDELDLWSKDRAKDLARVNSRLQRNALRNTLVSSFSNRGWNMYDSFGLWVFDPFVRSWCFFPFGSGWGSPYGYRYGFDMWNAGLPRWIYYTPAPAQRRTAANRPSPRGGTVSRPIAGETEVGKTPPFRKIDRSDSGVVNRRVVPTEDDGGWKRTTSPSMPSRTAPSEPSAPMPVVSSPRRVKGDPLR